MENVVDVDDAVPEVVSTIVNPIGKLFSKSCGKHSLWKQLFIDPNNLFPQVLPIKENVEGMKDNFVNVMQTSDVIGSPDKKIGTFDVFSNGGRLQPGCYIDQDKIKQRMYRQTS